MKKSQPPNRFDLENLEQRILLSGDSLSAATRAIAPDDLDLFDQPFQLEEIQTTSEDLSQQNIQQSYNPSDNLTDIFSGLTEQDALAPDSDQEESDSDETAVKEDVSLRRGLLFAGAEKANQGTPLVFMKFWMTDSQCRSMIISRTPRILRRAKIHFLHRMFSRVLLGSESVRKM